LLSTPLWETHVFVELYCLVSKDLNIDQVDHGIDPSEAEGITLSKAASILQNVDQDVEKETLLAMFKKDFTVFDELCWLNQKLVVDMLPGIDVNVLVLARKCVDELLYALRPPAESPKALIRIEEPPEPQVSLEHVPDQQAPPEPQVSLEHVPDQQAPPQQYLWKASTRSGSDIKLMKTSLTSWTRTSTPGVAFDTHHLQYSAAARGVADVFWVIKCDQPFPHSDLEEAFPTD
jgi:hypothetical protein